MNEMARWRSSDFVNGRRVDLRSGTAGVLGALVMVLAVAAASLVAVVFAATLAAVLVLAAALSALMAVAMRARPRPQTALAVRRGGHAWVAYGWNRRPR